MMIGDITLNNVYPELPDLEDTCWIEVAVRPKKFAATELRRLPMEQPGNALLTVYSGDMIYVSKESRHHQWIAAKVGYKVGWLNSHDIRMAVIKHQPPPPPSPMDWLDGSTEPAIPQDLLILQTQEIQQPYEEEETQEVKQLSSKEVSRIISRLKGFFGR